MESTGRRETDTHQNMRRSAIVRSVGARRLTTPQSTVSAPIFAGPLFGGFHGGRGGERRFGGVPIGEDELIAGGGQGLIVPQGVISHLSLTRTRGVSGTRRRRPIADQRQTSSLLESTGQDIKNGRKKNGSRKERRLREEQVATCSTAPSTLAAV